MTVKDILITVALLVNRKDVLNYLQQGFCENTEDVISEPKPSSIKTMVDRILVVFFMLFSLLSQKRRYVCS